MQGGWEIFLKKSWGKVEPVDEAFYRAFCLAERFLEALCQVQSQCLWPARLWKRFAECFANAPPLVRARGAHCKTAPRSADGEANAFPFAARPGRPCHIFLAAVAQERDPSPTNKGRGIAAAPLVRAIGFRLWLSFSLFGEAALLPLQPLSSEPALPRTPQRPCRTSWCRSSQARTARRSCRWQTRHPTKTPHSAYRPP